MTESLRIGVAQMSNALDWWENEKKILGLIVEAKAEDARLVVFPESGLSFSKDNPPDDDQIQASIRMIREAAKQHGLYVLFCVQYVPVEDGGTENDAILCDPNGEVVYKQYKIWCNKGNRPQVFYVDDVPCNLAICADRWAREACDLPVVLGSKVMIECSWASPPEYGKGSESRDLVGPWWTPKPVRNGVFLVRTNRANIIEPDGTVHRCEQSKDDQVLVRTLDLRKATRSEAVRRAKHPALASWWKLGAELLEGAQAKVPHHPPLFSENEKVRIAAIQMEAVACSVQGVAQIEQALCGVEADLIVLPERALCADAFEDLVEGDPEAALTGVRDAVRKAGMATVAVGMPWIVEGNVRNSAFVIAPDGSVLTRYDQISARPPFEPGVEVKPMWFQVNGVWCVVTLGEDHLWDEIAELAALRGAQIVINMNNSDADPDRRDIFWQAFSMFRTTSVFVNSVSNGCQSGGNGHSVIYDTPIDTRITYPVALERAAEAPTVISAVYSPGEIPTWAERGPARFEAMGDWWRKGAQLIGP